MLEDAYEQLTGLGFADSPRLMRGIGWIRFSFEEPYTFKIRWAPGPSFIELQPASTAWAGGALHPSSGPEP
jgi:hypothetical protein